MSNTVDTAAATRERRASSRDLIQKLTAQRTQVIVLFCRVAGLQPFKSKKAQQSVQSLLQDFCQELVDYIAAGHFSLYERIVNGKERRQSTADLATKLYPAIADTTHIAIEFNDKYDCEDHCEISNQFEADLSRLGEALAARIELEDELLQTMV